MKLPFRSNYKHYVDWIPNLSKEDKDWYYKFICAYYFQNKKCMDELKFPTQMRRDIYNRHRGVKNDVFNKGLTEEIDFDTCQEEEDDL